MHKIRHSSWLGRVSFLHERKEWRSKNQTVMNSWYLFAKLYANTIRKTLNNIAIKLISMHKVWKLRESKFNKLILIKEKSIYKGNPKEHDLNRLKTETTDFTFLKDLFCIPYSYINKIENESRKNYIKIFFGKASEEELYIDNKNLKDEIFEFIKTDNPNLKYTTELPSVITYAKAQLFALLFITVIFIWSLYLAIQIENGVVYELVGGGSPGITGIVLAIANLGVYEIILGYSILLGFIIFTLVKRLQSRSETEYLIR